jgi:hypothetical protein
MKRKKNILFRIVFLLLLLASFGVVEYYNAGLYTNRIELTSNENTVEPVFNADNNLLFDYQTDNHFTFRLTELKESHLQGQDDFSIIPSFCISVWRPPEIF